MGQYRSKLYNNKIDNQIENEIKDKTYLSAEMCHDSPAIATREIRINSLDNEVNSSTRMFDGEEKDVNRSVKFHTTNKSYVETNLNFNTFSAVDCQFLDPRSPNIVNPRTPIMINKVLSNSSDEFNIWRRKRTLMNQSCDADPRSPAYHFDRTPILKASYFEYDHSTPTKSLNKIKKFVPELGICIKLSYCETTNSHNIPEVQVLPDIIDSYNKYCIFNQDSNIFHDCSFINNSHESFAISQNIKQQMTSADKAQSTIITDNFRSIKRKHKTTDAGDKFIIWNDSQILKNSLHMLHTVDFQKQSRMDTKENEVSLAHNEHILPVNAKTDLQKMFGVTDTSEKRKHMEKKHTRLTDNTLYSPDIYNCRTPLANRLNNNSKFETLSINSSQQQSCKHATSLQENVVVSTNKKNFYKCKRLQRNSCCTLYK